MKRYWLRPEELLLAAQNFVGGGAPLALGMEGQTMQRDNKSTGFPTVLVAANDRSVRLAFAAELQQEHCLVLSAANADEALQIVVSHSRRIHVLLVDLDMDGIALAARLSRYRCQLQVVLFSEERENTRGALPLEEALPKVRSLLGIGQGGNTSISLPVHHASKPADVHEIRRMTAKIAC